MDLSILSTQIHNIAQGLKYPVIALLIVGVIYALFTIGALIVEAFVERRHFSVVMPRLQHAIDEAGPDEMPKVIGESGLLLPQKKALLTLFSNRDLPEESRWALAKKLLSSEKATRDKKVARNETIAKVAPMFGLMGTLIPLGPGVVAMGRGEVETLSASLLIAFDTTIVGLIIGGVCMVVARVRRTWYGEYAQALEAATTTMLEKIDLMEKENGGRLTVSRRAEVLGEVEEKVSKREMHGDSNGRDGSEIDPAASAVGA